MRHLKRSLVIGVFLFAPQLSCATEKGHERPMSPDRVNLTGADYLRYVLSGDDLQQKLAHTYVLGVLDATEGVHWCSYTKFKTISLRERIFSDLKKMDSQTLNERASTLIRGILEKNMPCGDKK